VGRGVVVGVLSGAVGTSSTASAGTLAVGGGVFNSNPISSVPQDVVRSATAERRRARKARMDGPRRLLFSICFSVR
jgi:hypothetical protein